MINFYSRQILMRRQGKSGQAAVLFLTTITAILALVFSALFTAHLGVEKVASSNSVDAIALSAATWDARGLNLIASLNDGILQCLRAIRGICVVWAALAVAACLGAGMSAFLAYSRRAPGMIRSYWKCAKQLEGWSGKVKDLTPYLVLAETASLSSALKVAGALHPLDPRGPHDGENTLELHLKPGPPLTLADAMSPVAGITGKIGHWKWAKKIVRAVTAVIDAAVRSILGAETAPIRMLEPEEDFNRRQKVRYAGIKSVSPLPIPFLAQKATRGFFMDSHAEPYGGSVAEMTWKSRLVDAPEKP
jgi:hypothetical protein